MNPSSNALSLAFACVLAWTAVAIGASDDAATPQSDREALIARYRAAFPQVAPADYIFGALAFSPDGRRQYDSFMDFPPFLGTVDRGKAMWERPFRNGKTFADCFPNGGRGAAAAYPRYEPATDRIVTFETALDDCLVANGEASLDRRDMATMGVLTAYARTLSNGAPMSVEVQGARALAKYRAGRDHFFRRRPPLEFSCAACHVDYAGRILRTEYLSPAIGQATHWPVFRGGDALYTLQARYKRCLEQIRVTPPAIGSDEFDELEYFHSAISNGLPLEASVYRK